MVIKTLNKINDAGFKILFMFTKNQNSMKRRQFHKNNIVPPITFFKSRLIQKGKKLMVIASAVDYL